jgi:hypothetical protein
LPRPLPTARTSWSSSMDRDVVFASVSRFIACGTIRLRAKASPPSLGLSSHP